jgi:subtilisin-like proprotein convertase family protein
MRRLWTLLLAAALVAVPAGASWTDETPAKDPVETATVASPVAAALAPTPRVGASHYASWPSPALNQAIPDNNLAGTSHDIVVTDPGVIFDLDLSVSITQTWVGDLTVRLTHLDSGTSTVLIDRPGNPTSVFGCSGDHISGSLDDEATLAVETQCSVTPPAVSGNLIPHSWLSVFDGDSLAGTWRLTVLDAITGDSGSLTGWALHFGVQRCDGLYATVVGTDGADTLAGTEGNDVIAGLKGNHTINGKGGNDVICGGGGGRDTLIGGAGSDWMSGGPDEDTADYSAAGAAVLVNFSARTASGGAGADTLVAIENAVGSGFADQILGSAGPNKIFGGLGND